MSNSQLAQRSKRRDDRSATLGDAHTGKGLSILVPDYAANLSKRLQLSFDASTRVVVEEERAFCRNLKSSCTCHEVVDTFGYMKCA